MDKDYIRQNRIEQALSDNNMKQSELCEMTGIKKASVNGWIKQNWQPKQDAIYKMAKALDVNEMWLAGYDVPKERKPRPIVERIPTADELRLMEYLRRLSPSQLTTVEAMIKGLVIEDEE